MADFKELTTSDMLVERMKEAQTAASNATSETSRFYQRGKAAAYHDAHDMLRSELKRLCNRFQNGILTTADFDGVI
jgi:hypothetical protein